MLLHFFDQNFYSIFSNIRKHKYSTSGIEHCCPSWIFRYIYAFLCISSPPYDFVNQQTSTVEARFLVAQEVSGCWTRITTNGLLFYYYVCSLTCCGHCSYFNRIRFAWHWSAKPKSPTTNWPRCVCGAVWISEHVEHVRRHHSHTNTFYLFRSLPNNC